jgi:GNAT superfamily N-acetyltransferase
MDYAIYRDKNLRPEEYSSLLASAGWGSDYDLVHVARSIAAYPFVAYARDESGKLVGYISAFSDGVFSTMLGELIVAPQAQGNGIGRSLLEAAEERYRDIPIYVKPLGEAKKFFLACGYRLPKVEMQVLFKSNKVSANSALDTDASRQST